MADSIQVPVWWKNGRTWLRRDALDEDHPEHTYNYIKRELGVEPEQFGITLSCAELPRCPLCDAPLPKDTNHVD